jgi:hypothetical protein
MNIVQSLAVLGVVAPLFGAGGGPQSQLQPSTPTTTQAVGSRSGPLYLHLLAPPVFTNSPVSTNPSTPAHRIVSTVVYPSMEFSVALGDLDDPFTNRWEGAWTNPRWSTNGIPEVRPLEAVWNSGDAVLAGRIDREGQKFVARLQGRNRTTLGYYHGAMELEKPVAEHGGWYRDGVIWEVWFALSNSPDCGAFLRQLDTGTLRSSMVEIGSPIAERWVKQATNDASEGSNSNPGGHPVQPPPDQ